MMHHRRTQSESGYVLLAVLFMVVLILVALAIAAPRIATEIQRDREAELIQRGKQYTRAIKLYYLKFHRYPASIDQLEKTNNMRFLRKRYVDPMTGKDDWKLIHFGEAHVKAMGLFGQPIQNGGMSATAGGNVLGGANGLTSNPMGSTNPLGGMTSTSSTPSTPTTSGSTGTDSSVTSSGTPSTTNTGSSSSTSPFGTNTGTSTFGSGQTFGGGGPIVGVASKNTKTSIKQYKQQKHYNEWEFVYDPVEDLMSSVSVFGGGTGANNMNGPGQGTTPSSGFPGSTNQNGFPGATNPGTPVPPTSGPVSNPPTSPQ